MTIKIHHNTAKKAKAHGITLAVIDGEVVATVNGDRLAAGLAGNKVLDEAIAKLGPAAPAAKRSLGDKIKSVFKRKPKVAVKDMDDEDFDEDGEPDPEDDEAEDDEDAEEGASVVKRKYKTKYRPFKMTCGDDLAQLVAKHLKVEGDDGKPRIDERKLYAFAVANNCWVSTYKQLNIGMRRMNVVNRLRARVRKGIEIKWA